MLAYTRRPYPEAHAHLKENKPLFKSPADPVLWSFHINLDPCSAGQSAETERWQNSCLRVVTEESAPHTLRKSEAIARIQERVKFS